MYKEKLTKRYDHPLPDSYFLMELESGETVDEREYSWKEFSEEKLVRYGDSMKTVRLCTLPAIKLTQKHNELTTEIDIPKDCQIYQSIKSQTKFTIDHSTNTSIIGRYVGIVKDGIVIEERFLDGIINEISGFKI
jgi:hypothetical protein